MRRQRTVMVESVPSDPHHSRTSQPEPSDDACFVSHSSSTPEMPLGVIRKAVLSSALHALGLGAHKPRYAGSIASAGVETKTRIGMTLLIKPRIFRPPAYQS